MQPSISINTLGLQAADFATHVDQVARIGAGGISPTLEEIVDCGPALARRSLADAGLAVATLTHRAFGYATDDAAAAARARLDATIAVAAAIGADSVTLTTGGREGLPWSEAARRFAAAMAPCAERAKAAGVKLALEPTSHLYADVSIAHRLGDAVRLARDAGIHVGIDLFACWTDADIEAQIAPAAPSCALVQVSDQVAGDRALPCRAVPGDGMIPLDRLIAGIVVEGGFAGWFDLELIGPRIVAEGPEQAHRRAVAALQRLISR